MASRIVGDLVASIPYPGGTRYQRVGALLEPTDNDPDKGPGFIVILDRTFNPAGMPPGPAPGNNSIILSVYHHKEKEETP